MPILSKHGMHHITTISATHRTNYYIYARQSYEEQNIKIGSYFGEGKQENEYTERKGSV